MYLDLLWPRSKSINKLNKRKGHADVHTKQIYRYIASHLFWVRTLLPHLQGLKALQMRLSVLGKNFASVYANMASSRYLLLFL